MGQVRRMEQVEYAPDGEGLMATAELHRVHEGLFDAVEEEDAAEGDQQRDAPAEQDVLRSQGTAAEEHASEQLDDDCHRVAEVERLPLRRDHVDRVDDGRRVHPEVDAEADQVVQIAVFGRQRRDDDAAAEAEKRHVQQQQRQIEDVPGDVRNAVAERKVREEAAKEDELDGELNQLA